VIAERLVISSSPWHRHLRAANVRPDQRLNRNLPVFLIKMNNRFADKGPDRRSGQDIGRPVPVII
jgi:hypothetical protein